MDNFKVPFCLFGENELRTQHLSPNPSRTTDQLAYRNGNPQASSPTWDGKTSSLLTRRNTSHLLRFHIGRLALIVIGLLVPGYLAGCGGGASLTSQATPPASTSIGTGTGPTDTGVAGTGTASTGGGGTGTSGTGGTGTTTTGGGTGSTGTGGTGTTTTGGGTGSTGTGGTGTTSGGGGTGSTGTGGTGTTTTAGGGTGTSGTGGTGTTTTGGGGTGSTGIGDIQDILVSFTDVNSRLNYGSKAGDWKPVCAAPTCAPGGSGVPTATSQTINNTDPAKDGKSMHLSLSANSSSAYTNALWVSLSGNCDDCTRIKTDFWIYITSTAGYVNTHEFDSFIFDKMHGYKNMWGMQCVNGGKWEIDSDFGWFSAGVDCNLTVGWHHIQVFNHRIINEVGGPKGYGYNYYDALIVDGVYNDLTGKTTPAEAYPRSYTQSNSGFQFQLDANKYASPVTVDEYLDMANFYGGN